MDGDLVALSLLPPFLVQGDLLLANSTCLGMREHLDWRLSTLLAYADSLQEDMQYRRALVRKRM